MAIAGDHGVGGLRVRDDIDLRSRLSVSLAGVNRVGPAKRKRASYWFDRRQLEQVGSKASGRSRANSLTLLRILDPKMVIIYG